MGNIERTNLLPQQNSKHEYLEKEKREMKNLWKSHLETKPYPTRKEPGDDSR